MADRVLNFKEFADKFSEDSEQNQAASVQDVAAASDNFSQGFDETTYDKSELGPNKPVAIGSEDTPAQPGEDGAPSFYPTTSGIESPEDCDDCDDDDEDGDDSETSNSEEDSIETEEDSSEIEDDGSYGNPEGDEDDDEDEDEDDEDDDEDDEDEDGEESNESFKWSTSKKIILESFDDFEGKAGSLDLSHLDMDDDDSEYDWREENDMYSDNDVELLFNDDDLDIRDIENDRQDMQDMEDECFVICQKCGATKMIASGDNPMSADKVDDPDSWWQGAEYGMNCGANPCSK